MKIGKNLCERRIGVFDDVEEIDFTELEKLEMLFSKLVMVVMIVF